MFQNTRLSKRERRHEPLSFWGEAWAQTSCLSRYYVTFVCLSYLVFIQEYITLVCPEFVEQPHQTIAWLTPCSLMPERLSHSSIWQDSEPFFTHKSHLRLFFRNNLQTSKIFLLLLLRSFSFLHLLEPVWTHHLYHY